MNSIELFVCLVEDIVIPFRLEFGLDELSSTLVEFLLRFRFIDDSLEITGINYCLILVCKIIPSVFESLVIVEPKLFSFINFGAS